MALLPGRAIKLFFFFFLLHPKLCLVVSMQQRWTETGFWHQDENVDDDDGEAEIISWDLTTCKGGLHPVDL